MSNIKFLITYMIYFSSDTNIFFSHGDVIKIKSEQFSEFDSRTDFLCVAKVEQSLEIA